MIRNLLLTAALLLLIPVAAHAENWVTANIDPEGAIIEYDADSVKHYDDGFVSFMVSESNVTIPLIFVFDCQGHMGVEESTRNPKADQNIVNLYRTQWREQMQHYSNLSVAASIELKVCPRHRR